MKIILSVLALILVTSVVACSPEAAQAPAAAQPAANAGGDDAENVRLVGYNDMQGRYALQVTTKSDAANGNWVYVANVANQGLKEGLFNPITKKNEWNGTSILETSDPAHPKFVWHIPNDMNASSRSASVVYDFGPEKKDYLIRNVESRDVLKFQIFDITSRDTDPSKISLVAEITGTPANSCGPGCGGKYVDAPKPPDGANFPEPRAHKGWWSQTSGLFYESANEPGFRSTLMHIWDLKDPKTPKFVGRAWLPGQKNGEPGFQDQYSHHPVVDEQNHRLYSGYREGSGQIAAFDITNPSKPTLIWSYDTSPPGRGPHTVSPIVYDTVPGWEGDGLPRKYAFVTDELGEECGKGEKSKSYMFDITHDQNVMPVSTFFLPVGNFCKSGGNFGPHQHAETINGELNRFEDKLAWVAYLNAGVRVVDLSDPYHLKEVGHYIPKTNVHTPNARPIQLTDVDIDHRGLAYATDRSAAVCLTPDGGKVTGDGGAACVGTGLFIFEYTGKKPAAPRTTN
jgi:LVIVD repeat